MSTAPLIAPTHAGELTLTIGRKSQARRAGLLYLVACFTAPFALLYVPGAVLVGGNATATADRIRASTMLLRMSIASEIFMCTMLALAVLALYQLFRDVDQKLAIAMVVLVLLAIPVQLLNVVNAIAAMTLTSDAAFLSVFGREQLDALAYFFMRLHSRGWEVAQVFWGLWLVPYGLLAIRSKFIPRVLGVLLIVAGAAYVLNSGVSLLIPQYSRVMSQVALVLEAGEVPMLVWLLIWGAKDVASTTKELT